MADPVAQEPSAHYRLRLEELEREGARLSHRETLISWSRLVTFSLFAISAWLAFVSEAISGWWSAVLLGVFLILVAIHDRVTRQRQRIDRRSEHNRRGLRRLAREWEAGTSGGVTFVAPEHPYAADLDLFGPASIFALISVARTRAGERTLASWLLEAGSPTDLELRRVSVEELRPRTSLRESVSVLGSEPVVSRIDLDTFHTDAGSGPWSPLLRPVLMVLSAANYTTLTGWLLFGWTSLPFGISIAISAAVALTIKERVASALERVEELSGQLDLLTGLVEQIENEPFTSTGLRALQSELGEPGEASRAIRQLSRLVALLDSRRNQLFLPFALLLFWSSHLAISLDRWKERYAARIRDWVRVIGRFEALLSLSSFSWEHPHYVAAEIVDGAGPILEGEGLGHPLIPEEKLVRNDVSFAEMRLFVVSGSNMSGKSTLLRTVGVNVVLALAGAPVNATRLRLSLLRPGASIQVRDSLLEGKSRFYAEILRLSQLVEMSKGSPPLLFLLDEILHGTNSHDRTIGATAILRALVRNGAIGLVTTHDLALARIADDPEAEARNVHFEDHIEKDEMLFDYRMRDGVVTRSNALALMRRIGLDV